MSKQSAVVRSSNNIVQSHFHCTFNNPVTTMWQLRLCSINVDRNVEHFTSCNACKMASFDVYFFYYIIKSRNCCIHQNVSSNERSTFSSLHSDFMHHPFTSIIAVVFSHLLVFVKWKYFSSVRMILSHCGSPFVFRFRCVPPCTRTTVRATAVLVSQRARFFMTSCTREI